MNGEFAVNNGIQYLVMRDGNNMHRRKQIAPLVVLVIHQAMPDAA